jgi:hypothetical protein
MIETAAAGVGRPAGPVGAPPRRKEVDLMRARWMDVETVFHPRPRAS